MAIYRRRKKLYGKKKHVPKKIGDSPIGCWKNSSGVPLARMAFGSYGRLRSMKTLRHALQGGGGGQHGRLIFEVSTYSYSIRMYSIKTAGGGFLRWGAGGGGERGAGEQNRVFFRWNKTFEAHKKMRVVARVGSLKAKNETGGGFWIHSRDACYGGMGEGRAAGKRQADKTASCFWCRLQVLKIVLDIGYRSGITPQNTKTFRYDSDI